MPLTTSGAQFIANAITNTSTPTFFNATNTYIAVGTDNTAFDISQTALVSEIPSTGRKLVDNSPNVSGSDIILVATYGTGDANAAWEEWGIFNDSSAGTMLSRKVESLGTKTSAQTWQITVTLTVSA
jgi:hypothetical protein